MTRVVAVAHDAVFFLPHVDDEPVRLRPGAVVEGLNGARFSWRLACATG